ncbi:MAG TPA: MarR family transcriptional regulator [Anaeromyxobacteraceae bacterium]|nr:MarR family transcriptional regulator [Anaeromyxobacteraceae bacterium]
MDASRPDEEGELATRLGPVLSFMRALWEMEHGLNARSKAMNRGLGLTGPQRLVLRLAERLGPITQAQLAHVLHLHPASVSRLVQTLNARGLLVVSRAAHDGRQRVLTLGRRARTALRRTDGTVEVAIRRALEGVRARDVERALAVVGRISQELKRRS